MGVVIDTSCLAKVLDPRNAEHLRFARLKEWVYEINGRMIYGGTKYVTELGRMTKFLGIVAELGRMGRVIILPKASVDDVAENVKLKVSDAAFDDEHLVAIVVTSGCRLVCTDDRKAIPYLKRNEVYADYNVRRPRIYTQQKHDTLCSDKSLPAICAPSRVHKTKSRKKRK